MDSQTFNNLIYLCKSTFNSLKNYDVVDHNVTTHATDEGVKNFYIAYVRLEGNFISVQIDLEKLLNNDSIENMYKYIIKCIKIEIQKHYFKTFNQKIDIDRMLNEV